VRRGKLATPKRYFAIFLYFNFFPELRLQAEQESQRQFYWRSIRDTTEGKKRETFSPRCAYCNRACFLIEHF
jgi:hypothetical protein